MPFSRDHEIEAILGSLGVPLVIECSLRIENVRTFCENPWDRTWLSSYHCFINPEAHQWDVDLYTEFSVPPENSS